VAVGLSEPENILPVEGIQLASTSCGIKSNGQDDLVLIKLQENSACAAVFTRNAFCAAPVLIAKKHLSQNTPSMLLINSGNANAGMGEQGLHDAIQSCEWVAKYAGCSVEEVLPFSTGVIGEPLPMVSIKNGVEAICNQLREDTSQSDQWLSAAHGIMTTDTIAKAISKQITVDGKQITITGIAKGSGMICPDMATLLAFIATDAKVESHFLQQCLEAAVDGSFNSITVDGDTSTNDACLLIASGASAAQEINSKSSEAEFFKTAVADVCRYLAQAVVRDGEGATKFVTVNVRLASSVDEARNVAYTIAHSPLVKTALFASDPNWGRILAAVGRAGINDLDIKDVSIFLDDVCIVRNGFRDAAYTEGKGQRVMSQPEFSITVELHRGESEATIWTTDLSHEYITINSEYRT
jgi:glutamate N-acetyltransferase/amino-acid N-acetyltransferase